MNPYLSPTEWFRIAVIAATIAVGGSYWLVPYGSVNLPNALYGPGLAVVALLALVLRGVGILSFGRAVGIGLAVPSAVLVRVAFDIARDPTSHNRWPLEVAIALALGMACALPAALLGTLAAKLRGTTTPREEAL